MACEIGRTWQGLKVAAQSVQDTGWKPLLHCSWPRPIRSLALYRDSSLGPAVALPSKEGIVFAFVFDGGERTVTRAD
jgi:hypothetical protein